MISGRFKMKKRFFGAFIFLLFIQGLKADEGMWIPVLLDQYSVGDMQEKGFKLSAEDIYSINHASLKDAVIIFGSGCTGELVSDQGLVFTNHHCGYKYIQSHSSLENDYLTNGFWAMDKANELPNQNISATFLIRIEDVSEQVLENTEEALSEEERQSIIKKNTSKVIESTLEGSHYEAVIKAFYYGNEYYMFVYEKFTDVRLVGTPPESIGNYGKDFDNWMWPRHTGDFSVFRIYAGKDNKPADYSPDNIPYTPKKSLSVSLKGIQEGDFTMVMGYPGTTTQFYISDAIQQLVNISYPGKIELRSKRLEIMNKYMKADDQVRIQYAAKYRDVSNSWKKWQGIISGIERVDAISKKIEEEKDFLMWLEENPSMNEVYGEIFPELKSLYQDLSVYTLVNDYAEEAVLSPEIVKYMISFRLFLLYNMDKSPERKSKALEDFKEKTRIFFKDYYIKIDREIYREMLISYVENIDPEFHPDIYFEINGKFKSDYSKYVNKQFKKSKLTDAKTVFSLLEDYPSNESELLELIEKDPFYKNFNSFSEVYREKVYPGFKQINSKIDLIYRSYLKALLVKNEDEPMYPDANFTMRIAYGEAEGYQPRDAVTFQYRTSLDGIIEKYKTGLADYTIPGKLLELYNNSDYGPYADEEGVMNVCFIASNHTTGGNSGSPVLNGEGQLIGLNFDRNWEGTMSDIFYDKSQCRNITVDIRYVLFIIDKFSGAGYLLEEMDIIK